ncbi:hypothetical protein ABFA25_04330 [Mycobacterium lepromatosis]|uniref:hypothetical protein n=1 Tax=Mycobacterium lepromatosis TaxID=480418 RepID=UPI000679893E
MTVGHRVVYDGNAFHHPTLLNGALVVEIKKSSHLATLHKTSVVKEIEVTRKLPPSIPRITMFANVFFHDL